METGKNRGSNPQPQVGRDISPPAAQPSKTEIQSVPVAQQPATSVQPTISRVEYNPISDAPDSDVATAAEEAEFADLVQNINIEQQKNVDKTQNKKNQKTSHHKDSRAGLLVVILALLVAIGLGVAAYFAFQGDKAKLSNQPAKVATSTDGAEAIKEAGNSVISSNDLDALSKSADSLGSLNDSEEFSTSDLTDKALGL